MITPEKGICANCGKHLKEHLAFGKYCPGEKLGSFGPTTYEDSPEKHNIGLQKQNTPSGRLLAIGFAKFILEKGYRQSRRKSLGTFYGIHTNGYKTIEELYDDYVGQGQKTLPVPPTPPAPPKDKPTPNLDYRIRDGYKNRHIDGLPTKACYIFVLHKEDGVEYVSLCYWQPLGLGVAVLILMLNLRWSKDYNLLIKSSGAAVVKDGKFKDKILTPTYKTNEGFVWYAETTNQ